MYILVNAGGPIEFSGETNYYVVNHPGEGPQTYRDLAQAQEARDELADIYHNDEIEVWTALPEDATLWVLTIEHPYGLDTYVATTEDRMWQILYEYVQEWWDDYSDWYDVDMPEDKTEAINVYFETVPYEFFTYSKCKLLRE